MTQHSLTYNQILHIFPKEKKEFPSLRGRWILHSSFGLDSQKTVIDVRCKLILDKTSTLERITAEMTGITEIYHFLPKIHVSCRDIESGQEFQVTIPGYRILNLTLDDENVLLSFMPHGFKKLKGFPVDFPVAWGQLILVGITQDSTGKILLENLEKILYQPPGKSTENGKKWNRCKTCQGILQLRPLSSQSSFSTEVSDDNFICSDCLAATINYYENLESKIIEQEQEKTIKENTEILLDIIEGGINMARNLAEDRLLHEFFMFRAFVMGKSENPQIIEEAKELTDIVVDFAEATNFPSLARNGVQLRKNLVKKLESFGISLKSPVLANKIKPISSPLEASTISRSSPPIPSTSSPLPSSSPSSLQDSTLDSQKKQVLPSISQSNVDSLENNLDFVMPEDIELDEDALALGAALNFIPDENDLNSTNPFVDSKPTHLSGSLASIPKEPTTSQLQKPSIPIAPVVSMKKNEPKSPTSKNNLQIPSIPKPKSPSHPKIESNTQKSTDFLSQSTKPDDFSSHDLKESRTSQSITPEPRVQALKKERIAEQVKTSQKVVYFQAKDDDDDDFAIPEAPLRKSVKKPKIEKGLERNMQTPDISLKSSMISSISASNSSEISEIITEPSQTSEMEIIKKLSDSVSNFKEKSLDSSEILTKDKKVSENIDPISHEPNGMPLEQDFQPAERKLDHSSSKFEEILFFGVPKPKKEQEQEKVETELFQFFNLSRKLEENVQEIAQENDASKKESMSKISILPKTTQIEKEMKKEEIERRELPIKNNTNRRKQIELCPMCGHIAAECTCGYMQMKNR
ncbi:MAG: hypothetical protein DRO88_10465 [Promethearchaeia archaeon]|nr:MAG: hypothetical protein DRO88_10465 [Candidatus Lokiarchaeia archaeon]